MFGRKRPQKRDRATEAALPDRRSMEKALADLHRLLGEQDFASDEEVEDFLNNLMLSGPIPSISPGDDPLAQAQDIMYDAWEAPSKKRRVELAHKALELSPDCADAYVLLAEEEAQTIEEAKALYEQGVEAGKRALGPEIFDEDEGHFWGILETRPYMRARAGLSECLWSLDERDEAIAHLQDMLRLNPNDNQGLRYILADYLLAEDRDDELGDLLADYEDDAMAAWHYTRALWLYRQEGESPAAEAALEDALEQNPHVPKYLLGKKKVPKHLPAYMGFGDENEAIDYALTGVALWQNTYGALRWLRKHARGLH